MKKTAFSMHVNLRHVVAECIGMALFVFVGTGAAVFFSDPKSTDFTNAAAMISNTRLEPLFNVITTNSSFGIVTALAFGIGIVVSAFSIGHVSGCHLNPAVTVSLLLSGNCGIGQAIANIVAQCGGACIGSLLLWGTSDLRHAGLGANSVGEAYTVGNAVLGEIVCTFILCYVVHLTAVDKNSPPSTNGLAPLAIGFAVFLASWLP
ncbi:hypothetical protein COHA_008129 [Chlorella ohadii]|uniref:Uncharacterized protein n=1 Tax=Chlorella ohadii TaxID=2649997 RepID=A0AAD5DHC1_9CHLO|nr:hypothetical protein COHA_008129 [Chlorella ohadii]